MKHQDPRYDAIQDPTGRIPADEPVFFLRGTDPFTVPAIYTWLRTAKIGGVPTQRLAAVRMQLEAILDYQVMNPELVHVPGTLYTPNKEDT